MKVIIDTIEKLKEVVLNEKFTDNQIKIIVLNTLGVFINGIEDRQKLVNQIDDYCKKYLNSKRRPKFFENPLFF
mgnify:CR=1 FL=1